MGKLDDWNKYANRSGGFEWVWNPNTNIQDENGQVIEGIRGFMQVTSDNTVIRSACSESLIATIREK